MKLLALWLFLSVSLTSCNLGTSEDSVYPKHYARTKACLDALDAAQVLVDGPTINDPDLLIIRDLMDQSFNAGLHNDDIAWLQAQHRLKALSLSTHAQNVAATQPLVKQFHAAAARCRK